MVPGNSIQKSLNLRFQVLSLDGGGIKGLFSAVVLAKLEEDLGVNVVDHFDLIVGTSTGGIIALGLGAGLSPKEIVQFYVEHGPSIFRRPNCVAKSQWLWRRKYPHGPLKQALIECFGETKLSDSRRMLVIPSYNLDKDEVYLFKTPHHPRLNRDGKEPFWKVGLATSAAPTFFPSCTEIDQIRLIDGGVWANNPTMVGVVESAGMLGRPLDSIVVLSIGTTSPVSNRPSRLEHGGLWQWKSAAIDIALRGQSHGVQGQAQHLLSRDRVVRLDPMVSDSLFALDKLNVERLLSEAAHESRKFSPTFAEKFVSHRAEPFISISTQSLHEGSENDSIE